MDNLKANEKQPKKEKNKRIQDINQLKYQTKMRLHKTKTIG